jgi:hypothetical protein
MGLKAEYDFKPSDLLILKPKKMASRKASY